MPELYWLTRPAPEWRQDVRALGPDGGWDRARSLAGHRLDFSQTNALDSAVARVTPDPARTVRLAIFGSCTTSHLHPAIRVAGLRRNIAVQIQEGAFGQYRQELAAPTPEMRDFAPDAVLLALDAHHLARGVHAGMSADEAREALNAALDGMRAAWRMARDAFGCQVIQQVPLPVHPALLGGNEHRLPGSAAGFIAGLSGALRAMADAEGVDLLPLDDHARRWGLDAWHDQRLWHHGKQEVSVKAAPVYGDLLVRLLAARLGLSAKCLVLDLDNTLWGGVVGDDGVEGIVLGQGNAAGEAHVALQRYALDLSRRGVILAVCSKNDEANAYAPFDKHPDMVLRRGDIACFVANWSDKAGNLRQIAASLNIGLDSLVFADDNPVERDLVRRELPMVAVPELDDDPACYVQTIADGGYFEGVAFTGEDRERAGQYQANKARETLLASTTDMPAYLRSLEMRMVWSPFDRLGRSRVVQLINKSNQFNLTTRRYSEPEIDAVMADPDAVGLQLRLLDRFGDNGVIAIVIGRMQGGRDLLIDTWLMSCRVLGRQVEVTTLNLLVEQARAMAARRLIGRYVPTAKNGMVRDHYAKLGFGLVEAAADGAASYALDVDGYAPFESFIQVVRAE